MNLAQIKGSKDRFEVFQTASKAQTAVMILSTGGKSSGKMNVHEKSDQVLLVWEGEVQAEVGAEKWVMKAGDNCIVAAGIPHRFENIGQSRAVTFNVYSPPEYSSSEKS